MMAGAGARAAVAAEQEDVAKAEDGGDRQRGVGREGRSAVERGMASAEHRRRTQRGAQEEDDIVEQAELQQPLLVILDLNNNRIEPVGLISRLKGAAATKSISIISFVAHVQAELKQQAQEAGSNMVLARSAFSTSLPQIFKRHTGSL